MKGIEYELCEIGQHKLWWFWNAENIVIEFRQSRQWIDEVDNLVECGIDAFV